MCGLFGWRGSINIKERIALSTALCLGNHERGSHSWGAGYTDSGRRWGIDRGVGSVIPFATILAQYRSVMAHTRHATKGAHTLENAHPFSRGNVHLAHNGVIYNSHEFEKTEVHRVDSELIATRIAQGKDLSDLRGYGVISWIDETDRQLRLCHVGSGDIHAAEIYTADKLRVRGVAYSSNDRHLAAALCAAGVYFKEVRLAKHEVYIVGNDSFTKDEAHAPLAWGEYVHTPYKGTTDYRSGSQYTHPAATTRKPYAVRDTRVSRSNTVTRDWNPYLGGTGEYGEESWAEYVQRRNNALADDAGTTPATSDLSGTVDAEPIPITERVPTATEATETAAKPSRVRVDTSEIDWRDDDELRQWLGEMPGLDGEPQEPESQPASSQEPAILKTLAEAEEEDLAYRRAINDAHREALAEEKDREARVSVALKNLTS
jgi:hypothetical protein